jgi:hypothetical protein
MITLPPTIALLVIAIIVAASFVLGYALASCMACSSRSEERKARIELREALNGWVQYIKAAMSFYEGCCDAYIVASLDVTAAEGRAFLRAFGVEVDG